MKKFMFFIAVISIIWVSLLFSTKNYAQKASYRSSGKYDLQYSFLQSKKAFFYFEKHWSTLQEVKAPNTWVNRYRGRDTTFFCNQKISPSEISYRCGDGDFWSINFGEKNVIAGDNVKTVNKFSIIYIPFLWSKDLMVYYVDENGYGGYFIYDTNGTFKIPIFNSGNTEKELRLYYQKESLFRSMNNKEIREFQDYFYQVANNFQTSYSSYMKSTSWWGRHVPWWFPWWLYPEK